ncbi:MAG: hypothetical protein EP338_13920 [Bacteroidetes bacterium]|nr:MAG: hypothetical protein EP338_13920 [Bacteroidota bacterium]
MKKLSALLSISLFLLSGVVCNSQITLDLREKTVDDIDGAINYVNTQEKENFPILVNLYDKSMDQENFKGGKLGSPIVVSSQDNKHIYTFSYNGDICVYELATGRRLKQIKLGTYFPAYAQAPGKNRNTIFKRGYISPDDRFLIFETFPLNKVSDPYNNYYVIDLNRPIKEGYNSGNPYFHSLYNFPELSKLDEEAIQNNSPQKRQELAIKTIYEKGDFKEKLDIVQKKDGIYFTMGNKVPVSFVELGSVQSYEYAQKFFLTDKTTCLRFVQMTAGSSEFKSQIENKYLFSEIIELKNGLFGLFATSYGSEYNARLIPLNDLLKNSSVLYDTALKEVEDFYKSRISQEKDFVVQDDQLYITYLNKEFQFSSPYLNQESSFFKVEKPWKNSYSWGYLLPLQKDRVDLYSHRILFQSSSKEYVLIKIGKKLNVEVEKSVVNYENMAIRSTITEENLRTNTSLIANINLIKTLPQCNNEEHTSEVKPSELLRTETCRVCKGAGTVYYGPKTGTVRCQNCMGAKEIDYWSGKYEKKKVTTYSGWKINRVLALNDNQILIECSNRKVLATVEFLEGSETGRSVLEDVEIIRYIKLGLNGMHTIYESYNGANELRTVYSGLYN